LYLLPPPRWPQPDRSAAGRSHARDGGGTAALIGAGKTSDLPLPVLLELSQTRGELLDRSGRAAELQPIDQLVERRIRREGAPQRVVERRLLPAVTIARVRR